jgi:hypothetical protein
VQGINNSVSLKLELLLLFLSEPELALVQSLHFVDEDIVSLQFHVLVGLDRLSDAFRQGVPLLALSADVRFVRVDRPDDLLLRALLLLRGFIRMVLASSCNVFGGVEEGEGTVGRGERLATAGHSVEKLRTTRVLLQMSTNPKHLCFKNIK